MEDPCLGLLYPEEAPINVRTLPEDLMRKINVKFKPSLAGSTRAGHVWDKPDVLGRTDF